MFSKFFRSIGGAAAFEYAVIAGIVSVAIVAGVTAVGTSTEATYDNVSNQLTGSVD